MLWTRASTSSRPSLQRRWRSQILSLSPSLLPSRNLLLSRNLLPSLRPLPTRRLSLSRFRWH